MMHAPSLICLLALSSGLQAQELALTRISDCTMEIQLGSATAEHASTSMLVEMSREETWRGSVETAPATVKMGDLRVEIVRSPLTITVFRKNGTLAQRLGWYNGNNGSMTFKADGPVFGLGQGGGSLDRSGKFQPMMDGYLAKATRSI